MLALSTLLWVTSATAQPVDRVTVHDLPGTDGRWQAGEVVVAAPAAQVQAWLQDARNWPARFPDVQSAEELGSTPDGRHIIRFRSRVLGRTMTVRVREQPGLIEYEGEGKNVTTQGKQIIEAVDDRHTRVIMQTSADVHGALRMFVNDNMKRDRARRKLTADLNALVQLTHATASTPRPGG
jgi:carbon monoxide dehydrogenase subunit G